jgi:hypothetical protein
MITKHKIDQFYKDLDALGLKFPGAALVEATGESKGNVSKYLNRKLEPSESFLKRFYEKFPKSSKDVSERNGSTIPGAEIFAQTIYNLTESNRLIAESNASLARSNEELVKKVTVSGERETLQDVQTKLLAIQEFVLERSVKKEPFRSKEEAAAALGIITTDVYKSMKKTGTHDGAGK